MKLTRRALHTAVVPPRVRDAVGLQPTGRERHGLSAGQRAALLRELGLPADGAEAVPGAPAGLYQHQREDLAWLETLDPPRALMAWEMGLGKSRLGIEYAARLGILGETLIVCPAGTMHTTWAEQIPLWAPGATPAICDAAHRDRLRDAPGPWVVNVDAFQAWYDPALRRVVGTEALGWALGRKPELLIIDESTFIKNMKAKRTKGAHLLAWAAPRVLLFSGNPAPNHPGDLYGQLRAIVKEPADCRTYWGYLNRYATLDAYRKPVGWRDMPDLYARIEPYVRRRTKAECLDLPEKVYLLREVTLTPKERSAYTRIRKEGLAKVRDAIGKAQTLEAATVLAEIIRLQQITGGAAGPAKTHALLEVLEESSGPVVVWCRFTEEVDRLLAAVRKTGRTVGRLDGQVTLPARRRALDAFRQGATDVLIANAAAGGHGIDGLQDVSSTCIYYSNSFSLEHRAQSEDRLHRSGQRGTVTVVDLVVPGSIDTKVLACLRSKRALSHAVLDDPQGWLS